MPIVPSKSDSAGADAGATTETGPASVWERIAAALSRTEGTDWSRCSVAFARGIRCGFGGWLWAWLWRPWGGDGGIRGSISRSKMADEEE